jgi:uncharacterized protein
VIRAVLDTNVLASGFVTPLGAPGRLLAAWATGVFELVVSEPILTELTRTFQASYFARRLSPQQQADIIALVQNEASLTPITAPVSGVATHSEDDRILATAVSAGVDYLVTGDGPLRRRVSTYQGVQLLSPREFLELLAPEEAM